MTAFAAALCCTRDHQFFSTEGGLFGFTVRGVREGDGVCVFNGAVTPHVLRRVGRDGAERYKFVGDAYVHGMMRGEADGDGMGGEEGDIVIV